MYHGTLGYGSLRKRNLKVTDTIATLSNFLTNYSSSKVFRHFVTAESVQLLYIAGCAASSDLDLTACCSRLCRLTTSPVYYITAERGKRLCMKDQGVQKRQTATLFREGKSHRLYWSEDREESTHMADSAEGGRGKSCTPHQCLPT